MSRKVRRVDWSPAEWLAGTRGLLTMAELAVYDVVLNLIYDRGGEAPNDAAYIGGHFKPGGGSTRSQSYSALTIATRAGLDRLIEIGKLHVSSDGESLTNGRADVELGRASRRIESASRAGTASGRARRPATQQRPSSDPAGEPAPTQQRPSAEPAGSVSADINDLAGTSVGNHQPSTINEQRREESDALPSGRASARARTSPSKLVNGGAAHDAERQRLPSGWRPTPDQREFAEAQGLDPDAVTDAFIVYWTEGKGRTQQRTEDGWNRTWRSWCRRDAERGGRGTSPQDRSPNRPPRGGGIAGAALRALARNQRS